MFGDGISYPLDGEDAFRRIVIGGLLGFASPLVLPVVVLLGYLVRVLGGVARGEETPPAFEDWVGLFVDGLKATVVAVVYGVIPVALIVVSVIFAASGVAIGEGFGAVLGSVGAVTGFATLAATALLYYLLPAALTNMAIEGSIGAAFDADRLRSVLLSVDYLIAWLLPFVIAVALNVATVALTLTIIGVIAVPFVNFYAYLVIFFMFGTAFGNVVAADDGPAAMVG